MSATTAAQVIGAAGIGAVPSVVVVIWVANNQPIVGPDLDALRPLAVAVLIGVADVITLVVGLVMMATAAGRRAGRLICAAGVGGILALLIPWFIAWSFSSAAR